MREANSTLERPFGNKRVFLNHKSHFASPSVMFLLNERPRFISFSKVLTIRTRKERKNKELLDCVIFITVD